MLTLSQARASLKEFQASFEYEKAKEYAERSQAYQAQIDTVVWQMHENGDSIAAIAAEYGTKNRNTIYEILRRKPQNLALPTPAERYKIDPQGEHADGSPLYTVTDTETGDSVTVAVPPTGVPVTSGQIEPRWKLPVDERPMDLYHELRDADSDARAALDRYQTVT